MNEKNNNTSKNMIKYYIDGERSSGRKKNITEKSNYYHVRLRHYYTITHHRT